MEGWYRVIVMDGQKEIKNLSFSNHSDAQDAHITLEQVYETNSKVDVQLWVREA